MRRTCVWLAVGTIAVAYAAAADDSGLYVGGGFGLVHAPDTAHLVTPDTPLLTGEIDDSDTSWGIGVGYRFNRNIAVELGYLDLGEIHAEVADAGAMTDARASVGFSADGVTLALLGTFPLGKWEPYLKAGALFSNTVLRYSGSSSGTQLGARLTNDNEDALYGAGVRYMLQAHLQIYLDATFFQEVGEAGTGQSDFLNTSAGVIWRF